MSQFNKKYGPWAVVTGASSGIGFEMSKLLAADGINLVIVARSEGKLNDATLELKKDYAVDVKTLPLDLGKAEAAEKLDRYTADLDVGLIIANAGVERDGDFTQSDFAEARQLIDLNVSAPLELSQRFSRRFKQRGGGGILLTSSLFGYQGVPYFANYAASKAYVLALGEALNVELKPFGIDVTVLSPGLTETPMAAQAMENLDLDSLPITKHQADFVAKVGLSALGKKASVIPGAINNVYAFENRLIPRIWPVKLFSFLIKRAYKAGVISSASA